MSGFRLVKQARAWWPVEWQGVAEDGTLVTNLIKSQFSLLKVDGVAKFVADAHAIQRREDITDENLPAVFAGLICRVLTNWQGVCFENGDPMPFDGDKWVEAVAEAARETAEAEAAIKAATTDEAISKAVQRLEAVPSVPRPATGGENLLAMMNETGVFTAMFKAFQGCMNAKEATREGN